jgi:hypothetical protein
LTVGGGEKRPGHTLRLAPFHPANEIDACENISPLIVTTKLQQAVVILVEFQEVVRL